LDLVPHIRGFTRHPQIHCLYPSVLIGPATSGKVPVPIVSLDPMSFTLRGAARIGVDYGIRCLPIYGDLGTKRGPGAQ